MATSWRLESPLVAETSRVSGESREIEACLIFLETFSSLQQVSETSTRRLRDLLETKETEETLCATSPAGLGDVAETSPRPAGDWNKSRKKYRTCLNFPRLPRDPASLKETSRRRLRNQWRLESPPSLQANEIGPQLPEMSPQLRRRRGDLRANWLSPLEMSLRSRPWWERKPFFGLLSRPSCHDWSIVATSLSVR